MRTPQRNTFVPVALVSFLSSCGALVAISNVNIRGPSTAPAAGRATVFANAISRPGGFQGSQNVTWSVVTGGATLEASTGTRVNVVMPQTSTDGTVTIRAVAVEDPSKTGEVSIRVIASTPALPVSDFSATSEGWDALLRTSTNAEDPINPDPSPALYNTSQGNPGGHLEAYAAAGLKYFVAPGVFLGPQTKSLNKKLRFDLLYTENISTPGLEDIVLQGGGFKLVAPFPKTPTSAWTGMVVPLNTTGGWRTTNAPATDAQITRALEFVDSLWIRSGFPNPDGRFANTPQFSRLDNVRIEP